MKISILSALILILLACAGQPPSDFITGIPENEITLAEAATTPAQYEQSIVRWGGRVIKAEVIVGSAVDAGLLRVEIIDYPLDEKGKPLDDANAGTRFIAYLEAGDKTLEALKSSVFKRNAFVTVVGRLNGIESVGLDNGQIQRLVVVDAEHYHRWAYHNNHSRPNNHGFSFGIGIGVTL